MAFHSGKAVSKASAVYQGEGGSPLIHFRRGGLLVYVGAIGFDLGMLSGSTFRGF